MIRQVAIRTAFDIDFGLLHLALSFWYNQLNAYANVLAAVLATSSQSQKLSLNDASASQPLEFATFHLARLHARLNL